MKIPERGAALILAMLVAALAATVAVALAAEQQRWFTDVGNRRDQVQAQSLALAGVQWARQILNDDAAAARSTIWASRGRIRSRPRPSPTARIEGRIEDAQGRFNLNNLALDTPAAPASDCASAASLPRKASIKACSTPSPIGPTPTPPRAPTVRRTRSTRNARPLRWRPMRLSSA
jgi:type II secretory pathway component PulK